MLGFDLSLLLSAENLSTENVNELPVNQMISNEEGDTSCGVEVSRSGIFRPNSVKIFI